MRQILFTLTLFGLLGCIRDKEANDNVILTLPFGKYYNWTNWEMKQINFRVQGNELQIDTTYNLKPNDFRTHHVEKLQNYPEIDKFLKESVTALQDLQNEMNKISCDSRHEFWIQYDDGTKPNLIKFRGTDDCDSTHFRNFNLVYQELKKIQDKYKP